MKTKAAVAWKAGAPLTIEAVGLAGPRDGEVLVEIKATGICHTDQHKLSGADPEGLFPAILGHEGAGVVLQVGAGVPWLKPGDPVIPLDTPECRQCKFCLSRKTNLCQSIRATQGKGLMPDGTSRLSINGPPLLHCMGTSTFANHTGVPGIALAKIGPDAPFDKVCCIGCGETTGVGAVLVTAKVEAGANVVVFGLGAIDRRRRRLQLRVHRQHPGDAPGAGVHPQGLGPQHHHRRGRGGGGDRHPAVPAGHRPQVGGLGLWRRARPHRRAQDRRRVDGRQAQHRRPDQPHLAPRPDQ